jgi:hypothetical protein
MSRKRKIRTLQEIIEQGSLCTVPEVAQAICVSIPSVYALAKKGKLLPIKIGDITTRFDPADVVGFIEQSKGT